MKRHNFTITELLTVIAIIAILAGIAIPAVGYARKRARRTACVSNQGQTMKIIINAMNTQNSIFYSGNTFSSLSTNGLISNNAPWTQALAEKGLIKSMEALRCTDVPFESDPKTITADSVKEAFGVVATTNNNGKFDFRGTRLFMLGSGSSKTEIAPSALAMGGCSTSDGKTAAATLKFASGATGSGELTGVHGSNSVNIFFYDGHAETVEKASITGDAVTYCYPDQTGTAAGEAKRVNAPWKEAVK